MDKLKINDVYNGIKIDVVFSSKFNILCDDSGTGKSLLLKAIDAYCSNNNINCILCDYNVSDLEPYKIKLLCKDVKVVLLDNADLYLTDDILQTILDTAQFVVISIHDITSIGTRHSKMYEVKYSNLKICLEEC